MHGQLHFMFTANMCGPFTSIASSQNTTKFKGLSVIQVAKALLK